MRRPVGRPQHDKALSLDTYVPNSAKTIRLKVAMASPLPNRPDIAPRLRTPGIPDADRPLVGGGLTVAL